MTLPPHVSLVTLGVEDVAAMTAFFERLGWRRSSTSTADVSFFHTGGPVVAVWGRGDLAADAGVPVAAGSGAARIALAVNVGSPQAADDAFAAVEAAGGTIVKPPRATDWGGYSGYFADPEGNLWEVAHNPGFPLRPDGTVELPD